MSTAKALNEALELKKRLEADLASCEKRIYDLETNYLEETAGLNVVHGWVGFEKVPLPHRKSATPAPAADRIFSLSSVSSPLRGTPWPESLRSTVDLAQGVTSAAALRATLLSPSRTASNGGGGSGSAGKVSTPKGSR